MLNIEAEKTGRSKHGSHMGAEPVREVLEALRHSDRAPHAGSLDLQRLTTHEGKSFLFLNLPYFLAGQLGEYIDWAIKKSG